MSLQTPSLAIVCSRIFIAVMLSVGFVTLVEAQSFPFVIPGDDSVPSVTDRSSLNVAPLPDQYVKVKDGHFFVGMKRMRFWGANLCFAANFPTHEEADQLAPHLAKLGFNAVRFHHMDMQDAPNGVWAQMDQSGVRKFDPEMIDRLDYFLAKLHQHGIYANINLHVSRTLTTEEGFPKLENVPWWASFNKWVMYYDRDVQAEVKRYCREMLTHPNPYRNGRRRADDPGIALVEMLNENYFSVQGYALARQMPERFQKSLVGRWNEWLTAKYGNHQKMLDAWSAVTKPMGDFLIREESFLHGFETDNQSGKWSVNQPNATSMATTFPKVKLPGETAQRGSIRFVPKNATEQTHFLQLSFGKRSTTAKEPVTLSYWVRADSQRKYNVELSTSAKGEWRDLGLFETLTATESWQKVVRVIFATESIANEANLAFSFGNDAIPIEFAGISLRSGAAVGSIPSGQSLTDSSIGVPDAGWPIHAHHDMKLFMVDTELQWTMELKRYLREELGVKVPITASQIDYHAPSVNQAVNDFGDLHNYWHHPEFGMGGDWNLDNWSVGNDPMEADPTRANWPANSLLMRTGWRYANKPMTISEWCYPEPSHYSAGCVPMAAVLAALQDWDAVFFFDYDAFSRSTERRPFFRDHTNSFFSFNAQPVKLALFSQFANVFVRGDLKPLDRSLVASIENPLDGRLAFSAKLAVGIDGHYESDLSTIDPKALSTPSGDVLWESKPPTHGVMTLQTAASQGIWGTIARSKHELKDMKVDIGEIDPNYGFVFLSSADSLPIASSQRMVLTVASRSENQSMGWNDERTSVGRNWGHGPTLVTSFESTISIRSRSPLRVYALDGRGQRKTPVPSRRDGDQVVVQIKPDYRTIWYEIERDATQPK